MFVAVLSPTMALTVLLRSRHAGMGTLRPPNREVNSATPPGR